MGQFLKDFFTVESVWMLVLIFFSRIVEVSMGTLRIILISKGNRKVGVILAFFEVLIWVFVASRVIAGITEEPLKGIIYSLGFASGVFVGSLLEKKIAFGKVLIQAITSEENGIIIANALRAQGVGVTAISGKGKDSCRTVLMIYSNRKVQNSIFEKINEIDPKAMVVSNEINNLQGGYITGGRRFIK